MRKGPSLRVLWGGPFRVPFSIYYRGKRDDRSRGSPAFAAPTDKTDGGPFFSRCFALFGNFFWPCRPCLEETSVASLIVI